MLCPIQLIHSCFISPSHMNGSLEMATKVLWPLSTWDDDMPSFSGGGKASWEERQSGICSQAAKTEIEIPFLHVVVRRSFGPQNYFTSVAKQVTFRNVPTGRYILRRSVCLHDFSWCNFPLKRTNFQNSYLPVGTFRNVTCYTTDPWSRFVRSAILTIQARWPHIWDILLSTH